MGPVYDKETESRRISTNTEIYVMVKKPIMAEIIRLNTLRWFGYVQRMEEYRIPLQKSFTYEFGNNKLRGRPRNRRQDKVTKDGRLVGELDGGKEYTTEKNGRSS